VYSSAGNRKEDIKYRSARAGSLAHKLHTESARSGLGYVELVESVKALHSDNEKIEKTIQSQKETIKQTQQELEAKLLEAETTNEILKNYLSDRGKITTIEENKAEIDEILEELAKQSDEN
jgi:hypothetical protein